MLGAAASCAALSIVVSSAHAEPPPPPPPPPVESTADGAPATGDHATTVLLLPSVTPAGDAVPACDGRTDAADKGLHRPAPAEGPVATRARELDAILVDAVQELGLTIDLSDRAGALPPNVRDAELVARAEKGHAWVISPRIEPDGSAFLVRIVAVPPDSKVARVREERVEARELPVRASVMLRDLVVGVTHAHEGPSSAEGAAMVVVRAPSSLAVPARSEGRAILALNAAIFGGFVGYAIQRSSGSDDPRLLYPLMALGTGVGLGASMIVAEEWDVGVGDAWYLSAGAWWPATAGLLLAEGRGVTPASDRYSYGLIGAGAGVGLATFALSWRGMSEGGALLAHSGGAFGTFFGAMTELSIHGSTQAETPYQGMGYGAAFGVFVAGTLATQVSAPPSRILGIDLGAGLGGLAGAAATSPFLFGKKTEGRERTFLVTTMASTAVGGAIGWLVTRHGGGSASLPDGAPMAGVIGTSQVPGGSAPIYGAGWQGAF